MLYTPGVRTPDCAERLAALNNRIISCRKCPRLVKYREAVAKSKRRAFLEWNYWGRPVPGLGDPLAELLIIGLAPAAHGGNRTGRVFTGDRSGDFLFANLYRAGFANQPQSKHRDDGLELHNAYIVAALRCAPPANKPLPSEMRNCAPYLVAEVDLLRPRAILALGRIAFDAYLKLLRERRTITSRAGFRFGHGVSYDLPGGSRLFASYHPSQQNTQTGKLTPAMFLGVLRLIQRFLAP